MSGTTTTEGYPYPLTSDFGDVQDAFRLASAIDADLRAEQAPFRAFMGTPSFLTRTTSNGSAFVSGSNPMQLQAVDWDNTGGAQVGNYAWYQPYAQPPSWWLFGATLLTFQSATPTVGEMLMGQITVASVDQVTGLSSYNYSYQRNDESGTNGEWINMFCIAPMYHGNAYLTLVLNGATSKGIQAGTQFWGAYLGPVI